MYLLSHIPDLHLLVSTIPNPSLRRLQDQPGPPLPYPNGTRLPRIRKPYHVFISHRGIDTKEKEAGLVFDYLRGSSYLPFLDAESLAPGEKLPEVIHEALRECKLGIVIFSPRFCESRSCLEELVWLVRMGKPFLPIFSDIEPSELRVAEYRMQRDTAEEVKQYMDALEEAKQVLGLSFKSTTG